MNEMVNDPTAMLIHCTPSEAEGYIYTAGSRLGFARRAV